MPPGCPNFVLCPNCFDENNRRSQADGQCGIGAITIPLQTPAFVFDDDPNTTGVYLGDVANIVQAEAGQAMSLARSDDGYVWHWNYSNAATKVPGGEMGTTYLENIVAVGTGSSNVIALTDDGKVLTWNWTTSNPVYAPAGQMNSTSGYLKNIVAFDAGIGHYLTVDETGSGISNPDGITGICNLTV